mgnify:CR=1 FL=1
MISENEKASKIYKQLEFKIPAYERDHEAYWSAIRQLPEKEYEIWLQRKDSGVPINESVQAEMNKVRDDLGLDYKFPWEA